MILAGHQPNYLPYPGFFQKIVQADLFLIVDNVQFVKRGPFGWIHRNRIRTPEGWTWLTVPVQTSGKFTQTILETAITPDLPWGRKHLRALEWNYRAAPHFADYKGIFEEAYGRKWESLCDLNVHFIRELMAALGIRKEIRRTSEMGITGKAGELIVNMCRSVGAETYLSGIHGRDYIETALFERAGIKLIFQEHQSPVYPQCQKGEFIPDLSIVDMLFNCGPKTLSLLADRP